jgi:PAS domain S-box-containing protein
MYNVEYRHRHKSGEYRWQNARGKAVYDEQGKPIKMIGSIVDITERKRVQDQITRMADIINSAPNAITIHNLDGRFLYSNLKNCEMHQYTLDEFLAINLHTLDVPASEAMIAKRMHLIMEKGEAIFEVEHFRKDGSILPLEVIVKQIEWDGDIALLSIGRDITERKKGEEEILRSRKSLEDLYRRLNEIREEERANISREMHDQLGQSLTALKIDLNRLQKEISTMPVAVARLNDIMEMVSNTIKDVQRISSELRPEILFDLGLVPAIEWYTDSFETRSGIKCDLQADDSRYDDDQKNLVLFRVLQEALTNVIRHANATSVSIKLWRTNAGTILSVRDNGIGISKEKADSIGSLGILGMRERARQYGGNVEISSRKNKGTTLTITIP